MMKMSEHCYLGPLFGFDGYRGNQEQAIEAAISGFDCFVMMPTGQSRGLTGYRITFT